MTYFYVIFCNFNVYMCMYACVRAIRVKVEAITFFRKLMCYLIIIIFHGLEILRKFFFYVVLILYI